METIDSRSDTIHRFDFVPGGRCSVEPYQRLVTFVGNANEENLERLAAEVQRGREGATR